MTREEMLVLLKEMKQNTINGTVYNDPKRESKSIALDMAIKALEQQPCEDAISRKWLKTAIHNFYHGLKHTPTEEDIQAYIDVAPSEQPKYNTDEWCRTCSEYDHDKHCCPRYNNVIRQAVEEMKQPKTGHWIYGENEYGIDGYHCDKCGFFVPWDYAHKFINYIKDYKFCPKCNARMVEPQESEEKE